MTIWGLIKFALTAGTVLATVALGFICLVGLAVWLAGGPTKPAK